MSSRTIKLIWKRDGSINWEQWWVRQHGYTRTKIPGPMDHVSFANFDLDHNNCPKITLHRGQLTVLDVPDNKLHIVKSILEYHGFSIVSVSQ